MKTHKNDHLTLEVSCNHHFLRQTWVGIPSRENFQRGSLTTLKLVRQHRIKRWLIDLRPLRMFNPTDLHWFIRHWLPGATDTQQQSVFIGIVLTDLNQFGKLGADLLLRAAAIFNPQLSCRYFIDETEARQWLLPRPSSLPGFDPTISRPASQPRFRPLL